MGVFKGLKNLSTKLLEKFKGMPEEITPQQFNEVINKAKKEGYIRWKIVTVDQMRAKTKEPLPLGLNGIPCFMLPFICR